MAAKLIYSAITSLDGYVADKDGNFDWGEPDEEVHTFVNDLQRPFGTHLYGCRMYEVMVAWENTGSMSAICSWPPSWWEVASGSSPKMSVSSSNRWTNAVW